MKTAIIFGSSGLIGGKLLNLLNKSNKYNHIKLFVRTVPENNNSKVKIIKTDFDSLEMNKDLIKGDDCFFCIGTTHKDTPDKKEYRRIEFNIPVDVGKIAKSNHIKSFVYISSMGANPQSSVLYLKNKGQVEEELKNLNFPKLIVMRPSILLGNRKTFRLVENISIFLMKSLSIFFIGILKKYKPIKVEHVAKAMLSITENDYKKIIFESDQIEEIGKQ